MNVRDGIENLVMWYRAIQTLREKSGGTIVITDKEKGMSKVIAFETLDSAVTSLLGDKMIVEFSLTSPEVVLKEKQMDVMYV